MSLEHAPQRDGTHRKAGKKAKAVKAQAPEPEPLRTLGPAPNVIKPLSVTINGACAATGLGRSKLYELIAAGKVKTIKVGCRNLVVFASLERLVAGEEA